MLHTDTYCIHTDPYTISEAEKVAREKIRELIKMGCGSRTGRLKTWSEKVSMLADKLIELGEVSHVMEQNDAATDENIMFSDEMTAAAEIMIEKGKRILQLASQIKCARAQSIKRAEERKEAEERQWLLGTQHYHFYEVTPIPLTTKTEKIDEEMTIEPRDPFDPYPYFDKKQAEAFYVKEEAFDCSSAPEDIKEKERERKRKLKKGKKTKKYLPILPTQPVPPVEKVAMPIGNIRAPGKKKTIIKGPHVCYVCGGDYMNIVNFNSHIAHHEGVTYKCPQCDKTFRSENSL